MRMHTPTLPGTHMHACTYRPIINTYIFPRQQWFSKEPICYVIRTLSCFITLVMVLQSISGFFPTALRYRCTCFPYPNNVSVSGFSSLLRIAILSFFTTYYLILRWRNWYRIETVSINNKTDRFSEFIFLQTVRLFNSNHVRIHSLHQTQSWCQ
jgi:hypothetical protein